MQYSGFLMKIEVVKRSGNRDLFMFTIKQRERGKALVLDQLVPGGIVLEGFWISTRVK